MAPMEEPSLLKDSQGLIQAVGMRGGMACDWPSAGQAASPATPVNEHEARDQGPLDSGPVTIR